MDQFRELCLQSAAALAPAGGGGGNDNAAGNFLASLGYGADLPAAAGTVAHQAAMLRAAAQFKRQFQLIGAHAPGLVCFGAEIALKIGGSADDRDAEVWSLSGAGVTTRAAFEACVGEAAELLSQIECGADRVVVGRPEDHFESLAPSTAEALRAVLNAAGVPPGQAIGLAASTRLSDGAPVLLPADLFLRRAPPTRSFVAPYPLSVGCAAGPTFEAATLHALLELVERDAACLWWRGGIRGRLPSLEGGAGEEAGKLLRLLRRERRRRRSWLLDITTDIGIPCIASISIGEDGLGFACGAAARTTMRRAAEAAVLEMCQIEIAHQVVAAKRRESGESRLNDGDRAHLRRCLEIDAQTCLALHPAEPSLPVQECDSEDAAQMLGRVVGQLAEHGVEAFALDLTRPSLRIPVVQVVCPALEKEPSDFAGQRLRAAIERTGGGQAYTGGVPLM